MLSSEKLEYSAKVSDDPIKKNKLRTFKESNTIGRSAKTESRELKMHVRLFSQMYISTQIRGGNMEEFFSHETLQYPPALARSGEMRSGNKSDLVKCIKPLYYTETGTNQECQLLFWKVRYW